MTSKFALRGTSAIALSVAGVVTVRVLKNRLGNQGATTARKRLWIIDQYAVPPSLAGFTRQHEHASVLAQLGWHTTIFATPFEPKRRVMEREVSVARPVQEKIELGVAFAWLYTVPYARNDWRRYVNMASFLVTSVAAGLQRNAPDVILASSPHLLAGLAGWILAKAHRVPFVLEVRDLWPDSLIDVGLRSPLVITLLRSIERFLYKRADHIITLSDGIQSNIQERTGNRDGVSLIPNAPTTREGTVDLDRTATRTKLGWSDRVVFIYSGALGHANAIHELVDAARLLQDVPDALLVILGDGPERSALQERAQGLENVEFLEPVPKAEVYSYLAAADVGLLSLRRAQVFEGVRPNKLFDYLAVGLPILTTIPGEVRELLSDAHAGLFVEPGDVAGIAAKMKLLAQDHELRATLAKNATCLNDRIPTRRDNAQNLSRILGSVLAEKKLDVCGGQLT